MCKITCDSEYHGAILQFHAADKLVWNFSELWKVISHGDEGFSTLKWKKLRFVFVFNVFVTTILLQGLIFSCL